MNASTAKDRIKNYSIVGSPDQLESAKETRGVARVNAGNGDVLGDNGARADYDMITNGNREDGSVCPNAHSIPKPGWAPEGWFRRRSAGNEWIINKHDSVRNEAVVPNRDQFADK
jgi:hypothetical protein